ncbi:hypothetical protein KCU77_g4249, partial [Aureobasidium melanogenum]
MATEVVMESRNCSLYNNNTLSDITVKFNGRQVYAHKAILAQKSAYFMTAFTSLLPVATSEEVDLGVDDDSEAVHAMVRYIYDLPYAQQVTDIPGSSEESLVSCLNVFTAADKYDVASLRPMVVKRFEDLMETNWESESFATSIQKLTAAAAAFCAKNLPKLIKQDEFVNMIQEEEPFTGRLLTDFLTGGSIETVQLRTCNQNSCRNKEPSASNLQGLLYRCVVCGYNLNDMYGGSRCDYRKAYVI